MIIQTEMQRIAQGHGYANTDMEDSNGFKCTYQYCDG